MAAGPESDGGGVLGNLPRSRPGQRSEKRAGPEPAKVKSEGARESPATRAASVSPEAGSASSRDGSPSTGPVGEAARLAGRAAKLGAGLAGGVLKRLPRP